MLQEAEYDFGNHEFFIRWNNAYYDAAIRGRAKSCNAVALYAAGAYSSC
jgi:hypothetical protein